MLLLKWNLKQILRSPAYFPQRFRIPLRGRLRERGSRPLQVSHFAKWDCPTLVCQGRYNTVFDDYFLNFPLNAKKSHQSGTIPLYYRKLNF